MSLSLGGYTEDDAAPPALVRALRRLKPGTVVVAAAGNNSSSRPFWPAALKNVIAVGALDTRHGRAEPAAFSNFGWWVDVSAPGAGLIGPYVTGEWQLSPGLASETFDGWACWSGTSFAAPLVAAEISRRLTAHPDTHPRVVVAQFLAELGDPTDEHGATYLPVDPQPLLCSDHKE